MAARADQTEKFIEHYPTNAATAWFHGLVDKSMYADFDDFLATIKDYATLELGPALIQQGFADQTEIDAIIRKACDLLGVEAKIPIRCLAVRSLVNQSSQIGTRPSLRPCIYDMRFDCSNWQGGYPYYPTGLDALGAEFARHLRAHVLTETGFDIGPEFTWRGPTISHGNWDWRWRPNDWGMGVNMAEELVGRQRRFNKRAAVKVLSLSGYYDQVAPFFGMERAFIRAHVPFMQINYEGGHMMYLDRDIGTKLADDVRKFIRED